MTSAATWGLAARLARRELRAGLGGFRIFLACLLLGVAAIAVVGSVSQALVKGLERDGRALLGGDIDLRVSHREASPEQRDFLAAQGSLSHVTEMRAMARPAQGGTKAVLVELKAVDGLYPLYGAVEVAPAQALSDALGVQDGVWSALVEPRFLRRAGLAIGDLVTLGDARFRIAGELRREPDKPARAFTLGPTFLISHAALAQTGLLQPGSLVHHHYRLRLDARTPIAESRDAIEAAFPEAGWRITDARRAVPRVQRFVRRLELFLTLVGLTSLLVGGIGVLNAVRSYLEGKTATIATLKCLGAPSRLVFRSYLLQVASLALLATTGGVLLGALSPLVADLLIGDQLGWRLARDIYPGALALAALFGMLTALTFALWPLARAQGVSGAALFRHLTSPLPSHIDAKSGLMLAIGALALGALAVASAADRWLALCFVLAAVVSLALFRLLAHGVMAAARRMGRPKGPLLRLALANLHRPGAATASVVLALGLGLTMLVAVVLIEANLDQQVRRNMPADAPGFYFIDIQPDQAEAFDQLVVGLPGSNQVERVPMLRGRITAINGKSTDQWEIPDHVAWVFRGDRGLTWRRDPVPDTELVAGTWWPADYAGAPLVSLDAEVGRALGIGPGDRLSVNLLGREFEVEIANLRVIDWSDLGINFVLVFSPGLLEAAPQTHIATVRSDPAGEDALEEAVLDAFPNVSAIRVKEALAEIAGLMEKIAVAVKAIAALAILVGVLVLAGTVAAGHRRRLYDSVVLKVLGATRGRIARGFLLEYGLLGALTAVFAAVLGSVAAYLVLIYVMRASFVFMPGVVAATASIAAVTTLVFGLLAGFRALGQKTAPLLRNE